MQPCSPSAGSLIRLLILFYLLFLTFPLMAPAGEPPGAPFQAGEKLTYRLRWGFIPAGEAVLAVLPDEELNGVKCRHFRLTADSNSFIDLFYKVRDRVDSYTDLEVGRSLLYRKKQREGGTRRDVVVSFDLAGNRAQYANKGVKKDPVAILPGTLDPLAAYYYIRKCALREGSAFERPITDGKKNVIGLARVVRRETVSVGGVNHETFLLEPDLKDVGGVFEKSRDSRIRLWITADDRRILVKIESRVVVGSFVGELVSVE